MRGSPFPAALGGVLMLLGVAGCAKPKELYVDHAWVRLPAVPRQPGAAYFTIHGGPRDRTLIDVSTDVAIKAEMHETMAVPAPGGTGAAMARMTPMRQVPIAAKSTDRFAPGGRHVMLFDINPGIKPGGTITLTFTFADGERIQQFAPVVAAGDPAPKG